MANPQKVILIGPMGVGKSTIGNLLARELGWRYIDNDADATSLTRLSEDELSQLPVSELHLLESQHLKEISEMPAPFVAGAAASVVDYSENIKILKGMTSIYLRIPLEQIFERAGREGIGRRNVDGDLQAVLEARFLHRDPIYSDVAKYRIDLGDIPNLDVKRILNFLQNGAA